jgi:NAD(P)-dependent dehydrogenase (short-subunit alcohol dehydrogenase family)
VSANPPSPTKLFDLSGKVAVVTGGSRGLGRVVATGYAQAGADVVVASRKLEACEAVADDIRKLGRRALPVAYHAGHWEDAERLTDAAYAEFGHVDILVCNAGSAPAYPSIVEISEELFDKTVAINLKGAFRLAALVGTRMREAGSGSIIFVSSVGSWSPTPRDLIYGAAKAGLNALTHGLATTLGPEVRVNAVLPGPFRTDITKAWDMKAFERAAVDAYALGRVGEPGEILGACVYLASDASTYTTSVLLNVDGGPRSEVDSSVLAKGAQ